jgi:hypothetical protein
MGRLRFSVGLLAVALSASISVSQPPGRIEPPANPVTIGVSVSPAEVSPGAEATVTIRLDPAAGVKINRYPKVRVRIAPQPGLAELAEGSAGDSTPPPMDQMADNYFDTFEPLEIAIKLAPDLSRGAQELDGKIVYFYCMPASGFCAPVKTGFKIPVQVN